LRRQGKAEGIGGAAPKLVRDYAIRALAVKGNGIVDIVKQVRGFGGDIVGTNAADFLRMMEDVKAWNLAQYHLAHKPYAHGAIST